MDVTKEQIDASIDLLTTMVVEDIAKEQQRDPTDVLPKGRGHSSRFPDNQRL